MNSILNTHWNDWCSSSSSNILATWCEELTHWKRPWCWERLKAGGEGGDRGWDGWMASLTWWTWVWTTSLNWWWTGRPGMLQSMWLQRVGHDRVTELNWTDLSVSQGWLRGWFKRKEKGGINIFRAPCIVMCSSGQLCVMHFLMTIYRWAALPVAQW